MKTTKKQIKLSRIIDVLDRVQKAYQSLAAATSLIHDPDKYTVEFCREMLEIKQPMLVQKGSGYYLISGYREWQMALCKLNGNDKINCQVVTEASPAKLNSLAWHDAYGCMLAYGINPKKLGQQFKQVLTLTDNEVKQNYFAELSNVSQLKKATDLSRGTFYSPKADKEAEHQSFDDVLKDVAGKQG